MTIQAIVNNAPQPTPSKTIHIIRHGEALHKYLCFMSIGEYTLITPSSIDRTYNLRDPPLTDKGFAQAEDLRIQLSTIWKIKPTAIVTSPMTRTIQTVCTLFPSKGSYAIPLYIWPVLREAHDANCNQGRSRAEMQALHADLDFSACDKEWNYNPHRFEDAADRAEAVRKELMKLPGPHVVLVGHRGFIAYLVDTHRVKFRDCGVYCICRYHFLGLLS